MKKAYTAPAVIDQRTFAFETKQSGKSNGHGPGGKDKPNGPWGRQ